MKLACIYFTNDGEKLALRCRDSLRFAETDLFDGRAGAEKEDKKSWLERQFREQTPILFVGACGIAVRLIAPFLVSKLTDSPVLVIDDCGKHVIPILAGHIGGANELAVCIGEVLGATPVITTATDNHGVFSVDLFAKRNQMAIGNPGSIKRISGKLLSGDTVRFSYDSEFTEEQLKLSSLPEKISVKESAKAYGGDFHITGAMHQPEEYDGLLLIPKDIVLGMGCRKGKEGTKLKEFVEEILEELGIHPLRVAALVSIDVKKEEPGLKALSRELGIPFHTFSAQILKETEGEFEDSVFVETQVGVGNVCQRAVAAFLQKEGRFLGEKYAKDGMTLAIGQKAWEVKTWDTSIS